jgi:uncharacterized repeat protein (TIGR04076 family)
MGEGPNNHMHPTSLRSWVCVRQKPAQALVCEVTLPAPLGGRCVALGGFLKDLSKKGVRTVKSWYHEDWSFMIEVLRVGKENRAEECRLGLEPGDTFTCRYETPAGFCPTSFIKIFPALEVVRDAMVMCAISVAMVPTRQRLFALMAWCFSNSQESVG